MDRIDTRSSTENARHYDKAPSSAAIENAATALTANGFEVHRVADAGAARALVLELIPAGSAVYQATSQTLELTGITDAIEGLGGDYIAVRTRIRALDRQTQRDEIRRLAASPDVMVGSVHAVTESGSLVIASNTGSQLGAYAVGAGRVILVVGTQKIVSNLEDGLRRITEYCLPLENARTQSLYGESSAVNKVLILHREKTPGRIAVVLLDEVIGF